ncbi:MAG: hypothetical protein JNM21_13210 [Taibaiella sp.]|nr:hypothetical protein [Taibaiella sp.]
MKQLFITGLALMLSGSAALAQYADDPYSNSGSTNGNRSTRYEQDQRYSQDNYTNDSYNDEYGDGYIDYDDDSYTTRFRRFNDVYAGYNYWSPVFSPYWAMPVYMDPWYYSPYRMGWGISLGWSWGSPYWNSGWGMCNWWGYNGFNYWNRPYMGWGWGGGFGYTGWGYGWGNGYGWGYGNVFDYGNRRGVNYGPRRSYGSTVGGYRGSNGIRPNPGTVGSGRDSYRRRGDMGINSNVPSRSGRNGVINQGPRSGYTRDRVPGNNNGIRINEGSRRTREVDNNNFNRGSQPGRERNYQSDRPNRVAPRESTRPSRSYEGSGSPAPSRSYSAPSPAPSRSNFNSGGGGSRGGGFGGGSGGGGSRGGGGYRR